ncbi:MAG: ABC transporter permease [Pseudomonadota bacterium]|nr:ABC transporter permease [Pseudomonadota bacterium]
MKRPLPHARFWATLAAVLVGLLLWEGLARVLASPALPPASAVARFAVTMFQEGGLLEDLATSLGRVLVGYTLAAALGLGLGGLVALGGTVGAGALGAVQLLRPIPPIAWVPLAILWCGLGDKSAWFIVFIGAFFPIFTQVAWALAGTPAPYLELAQSLGASRWLVLTRIRFPAAAPGILAGLRTGLGLAWTSVVAAELVGAQSGLGYRIQMHRLVLETEGIFVGMACIGALGFGMDLLARRAERWITRGAA